MKVAVSQRVPLEWSREQMVAILRELETQLNLLAEGRNAAYHGARTAAPTTGDWAQGDWVKHSTPTSGGNFGWVCTASGTPGTWKAFGTIA